MFPHWQWVLALAIGWCLITHGSRHRRNISMFNDCYVGYSTMQYIRDVIWQAVFDFIGQVAIIWSFATAALLIYYELKSGLS